MHSCEKEIDQKSFKTGKNQTIQIIKLLNGKFEKFIVWKYLIDVKWVSIHWKNCPQIFTRVNFGVMNYSWCQYFISSLIEETQNPHHNSNISTLAHIFIFCKKDHYFENFKIDINFS